MFLRVFSSFFDYVEDSVALPKTWTSRRFARAGLGPLTNITVPLSKITSGTHFSTDRDGYDFLEHNQRDASLSILHPKGTDRDGFHQFKANSAMFCTIITRPTIETLWVSSIHSNSAIFRSVCQRFDTTICHWKSSQICLRHL